jgi:hypothetical protein
MSKYGPGVADGTIVGILCVCKRSAIDELSANNRVLTVLVAVTTLRGGGPVPVAEFCLVGNFGPGLLSLTENLVVDNIVASSAVLPLSNVVRVAGNPFWSVWLAEKTLHKWGESYRH